ncbi:MAG: hypothetical protein IH987_05330 [Planctomycetes bacterium]|nr:hypothetical protein [Planctomycetota bacterium]
MAVMICNGPVCTYMFSYKTMRVNEITTTVLPTRFEATDYDSELIRNWLAQEVAVGTGLACNL